MACFSNQRIGLFQPFFLMLMMFTSFLLNPFLKLRVEKVTSAMHSSPTLRPLSAKRSTLSLNSVPQNRFTPSASVNSSSTVWARHSLPVCWETPLAVSPTILIVVINTIILLSLPPFMDSPHRCLCLGRTMQRYNTKKPAESIFLSA